MAYISPAVLMTLEQQLRAVQTKPQPARDRPHGAVAPRGHGGPRERDKLARQPQIVTQSHPGFSADP